MYKNPEIDKSLADRIFRDRNGNVVLFQAPNIELILFFFFVLLSLILSDPLRAFVEVVAYGMGFSWAYSEMTNGVNGFRKVVGLLVLTMLICIAFRAIARL